MKQYNIFGNIDEVDYIDNELEIKKRDMNFNYWVYPSVFNDLPSLTKEEKINLLILNICKRFKITRNQLMSKSRLREYVEPRQIAMYIIHKIYGLGAVSTAKIFNKNHATVLYASNTINGYMQVDEEFKKLVKKLI